MTERLRLFLVEDDEDLAFVLRRHLERADFGVTLCRTGDPEIGAFEEIGRAHV